MSHSVYIDHPDSLDSYDFLPDEKDGDDVVTRKLGIRAIFVCNAYAKISKGDIYEIAFDDASDAIAFVLKCEYKLVDKDKVEEYRNRKNKRAF